MSNLLDYKISELTGLELTPEQETEWEQTIIQAVWLDFLNVELDKILGKEKTNELFRKIITNYPLKQGVTEETLRKTMDSVFLEVKREVSEAGGDIEDILEEKLSLAVTNFVKKIYTGLLDKAEPGTEQYELYLSLIRLSESEDWDKLVQIFKKRNESSPSDLKN